MDKNPELCKVEDTLHIIVGKWKPIIIMRLLFQGTFRFNELKRTLPGITTKTLTAQLRELEEEDIIERVIYPQIPPKVEYSITEYGRSLMPVLDSLHNWGTAHLQRKTQGKAAAESSTS
ncbi:winged helix-turn-helix transcriptional regulator [Paenibacillus sp. y28]|uniref:winged helix-turn-helix transcriptional regulator n=1 Tax=Paenibacillus sp. y28 TaxID=3129110 RepID=UPI0030170939